MIFQPRRSASTTLSAFAAFLLVSLAGTAPAQTTSAPPASSPKETTTERSTDTPQRDTMTKMTRLVSIEFKEHRLEDVLRFIGEVTHADIECLWTDDKNSVGLDKDTLVTLKFDKGPAMDLLEKVLDQAQSDSTGKGNSWQLTESGTLQVGPKDRLDLFKYVKAYPIADLLFEVPNFANAPDLDLESVLQSQVGRGGGSGGQSIFKEHGEQKIDTRPLAERVKDIEVILTQLIEPDHWVENGGNGASIRYFQNTLVINAPDYIHRQINGYPYWPAKSGHAGVLGSHRVASNDVGSSSMPAPGMQGGRSPTSLATASADGIQVAQTSCAQPLARHCLPSFR